MVHKIWQDYPELEIGLSEVKNLMKAELKIKEPDIRQKIEAYIDAPGKYLRAGLLILFSMIRTGEIREDKIYQAAAIELLHLATLIHDDVIDESELRRGMSSFQVSHSNRIAIYAGDYLIVMAGHLLKDSKPNMEGEISFTWAMEGILEGEILQLVHRYDYQMTLQQYLRQIRGKTALLFALACYAGYYQVEASKSSNKQAFYLGEKIGMAFQITDDLLDYQVSEKMTGKPQLQDIRNGIYSAPIIFALDQYPSLLLDLSQLKRGLGDKELKEVMSKIEKSKSLKKTQDLVNRYEKKINKSIRKLSGHHEYKDILESLLGKIMTRNY